MNNILLAGVGVTAFPSYHLPAANYDAGPTALLQMAILPPILLMIFSFIDFSRKNFNKWNEASKAALNPVRNFKINHPGIFS